MGTLNQKIAHTFRSLSNRNFRIFFIGQGISVIGTWMQQVAIGWLIYRLTNSAIALGFSTFLTQIPALFLSPLAGAYIDKVNKLTIVKVMQALMMILAFTLAFFTLSNLISVQLIYILYTILGICNAIEIPARQSMFVEMLDNKEDLSNAIALNSNLFNAARLLGPSIAGVLLLKISEGVCFLINGISFAAVLISLFMLRLRPHRTQHDSEPFFQSLKEGFIQVKKNPYILNSLILLACFSLFGVSFTTILPVIAVEIYHGSSSTLGFLMSSLGCGAMISTLYLASRRNMGQIRYIIFYASVVFSISLIFFSISSNFALGIIMIFIAGGAMVLQSASTNTLLQITISDEYRGRVMGLHTFAFRGIMPFGSMIIGFLAEKLTASISLVACGFVCLIASIMLGTRLLKS